MQNYIIASLQSDFQEDICEKYRWTEKEKYANLV